LAAWASTHDSGSHAATLIERLATSNDAAIGLEPILPPPAILPARGKG
jgi:hypothetical protein